MNSPYFQKFISNHNEFSETNLRNSYKFLVSKGYSKSFEDFKKGVNKFVKYQRKEWKDNDVMLPENKAMIASIGNYILQLYEQITNIHVPATIYACLTDAGKEKVPWSTYLCVLQSTRVNQLVREIQENPRINANIPQEVLERMYSLKDNTLIKGVTQNNGFDFNDDSTREQTMFKPVSIRVDYTCFNEDKIPENIDRISLVFEANRPKYQLNEVLKTTPDSVYKDKVTDTFVVPIYCISEEAQTCVTETQEYKLPNLKALPGIVNLTETFTSHGSVVQNVLNNLSNIKTTRVIPKGDMLCNIANV